MKMIHKLGNAGVVSAVRIGSKILMIRNTPVMLDRDLAVAYGVPVKVLNQAVKRSIGRFPPDAMFKLNKKEAQSSRSQFVTLKRGQNIKYLPYAFTELGVAMLSSVLSSKRAIMVNLRIMREFIQMKKGIKNLSENSSSAHKKLLKRIKAIENNCNEYQDNIYEIFMLLDKLETKIETTNHREKDYLREFLEQKNVPK